MMSRRGLLVGDLRRYQYPETALLSPTGTAIAVVVASLDFDAGRRRSLIAVIDLVTGEHDWLPDEGAEQRFPAWSRSGDALAYIQGREATELLVYSRAARETRAISPGPAGIVAPGWSPSGTEVALLAFGPAKNPTVRADPRGRAGVVEPGTGWTRKVWTVNLETAEWLQRTEDEFEDGGPCGDVVWAPDGAGLVFASDRTNEWRHHYETSALYHLDLRTESLRRLTPAEGRAVRPRYSPDGTRLAYIGSESADRLPLVNTSLWTLEVDSGEREMIHDGRDNPAGFTHTGSLEAPVWLDGGGSLACIISEHGTTHLFAFDKKGAHQLTTGDRVVESVSADRSGALVAFLSAEGGHPRTVGILEHSVTVERVVLDPNEDWLRGIAFMSPRKSSIQRGGVRLDYWLVKPDDGRTSHPLILDLHGLTGGFADDFYFDHQVWAAQGYAVAYCNPRGSYGDSEALLNGSVKDFGGADAEDVLAVLDAILERHADLDPQRVGLTGYSYGGYLTDRLLGLSGRFRVAASGGGPTNFISWIGTSDLSEWFLDLYLPAPLLSHLDWYIERSPVFSADKISTPLLLYHGAADTRVPLPQAEELFRELRRRDCKVELLVVPDESHMMSPRVGVGTALPSRQLALRRAIFEWLDDHLAVATGDVATVLREANLVPREEGLENIAATAVAVRRGLDALTPQLSDDIGPFDSRALEQIPRALE